MTVRRERVAAHFKSVRRKAKTVWCDACQWVPPIDGLREIGQPDGHKMMHAHHVVPLCCGGPDEAANLVLLCPNCHGLAHRLGQMKPTGRWPEYLWTGPSTREALLHDLNQIVREPVRWAERHREAARLAKNAAEEPEAQRRRASLRVVDGAA